MEHVFFSEVNWDDVYDKKARAIFNRLIIFDAMFSL